MLAMSPHACIKTATHCCNCVSWLLLDWTSTGVSTGEYAKQELHITRGGFSTADTSANFSPSVRAQTGSAPNMSVPKLAPSTSSLRPPGPGAYHHETHHRSRGNLEWLEAPRTGHCSAFKAIARKTEFDGRHTAPPPGTYDLSKVHAAWFAPIIPDSSTTTSCVTH